MFEAASSGAAAGIAAKEALIEGFGLVLDLLRAGKISEASDVAERVMIKGAALSVDMPGALLADMVVKGPSVTAAVPPRMGVDSSELQDLATARPVSGTFFSSGHNPQRRAGRGLGWRQGKRADMAKTARVGRKAALVAKGWPADAVVRSPVADLVPYARNARTHSEAAFDHNRRGLCRHLGTVLAEFSRLGEDARNGETIATVAARLSSQEQAEWQR